MNKAKRKGTYWENRCASLLNRAYRKHGYEFKRVVGSGAHGKYHKDLVGECLDEAALAKADFKKATPEKAATPARESKELAEEAAEKSRYMAGQVRQAVQSARYAKQAAQDFAYWGDVALASFAARNAAAASKRAARLRLRLAKEKIRAKQYEKSCQALLLESRIDS